MKIFGVDLYQIDDEFDSHFETRREAVQAAIEASNDHDGEFTVFVFDLDTDKAGIVRGLNGVGYMRNKRDLAVYEGGKKIR